MKKQLKFVTVAIALLAASITAQAQFKKSDKILEGSVSYSKTTGTDGLYSLNPSLGIFLSDRFAVGAGAELGKTPTTKSTGVGVWGRCYLTTVGKNLHVFSQLGVSRLKSETGATELKTTDVNLGFGANYFVGKKIALTANLTDLINYSDAGSTSTFTVGLSGVSNPLNAATFGILLKL